MCWFKSPISKIGYFHFGETDKADPVRSLQRSLEQEQRTRGDQAFAGALIVLPEAFNIKGDYFESVQPDPSVEASVRKISKNLGVCFVVGLIDRSKSDRPGYSRACLIDGSKAETLTYKADRDGSPNYVTHACWDRPLRHRGVFIVSLICHDAADDTPRPRRLDELSRLMAAWQEKKERHRRLLAQMTTHPPPVRVALCIPGRMNEIMSERLAKHWLELCSGSYVIIANGTAGSNSVICHGELLICSEMSTNSVVALPWCDLD